jgi:hypothetical protein
VAVEQVDDLLVVDLEKGGFDVKLSVIFSALDLWKKVTNNLGDHSFLIAVHGGGVGSHGKGLAT